MSNTACNTTKPHNYTLHYSGNGEYNYTFDSNSLARYTIITFLLAYYIHAHFNLEVGNYNHFVCDAHKMVIIANFQVEDMFTHWTKFTAFQLVMSP